ncbi:MAG: hypothetical protein ACJAWW_002669, partial [Sulfurimonas sp.]
MSKVIGKIESIDGKFYAKAEDGSLREITKGDEIHEGDSVVGDSSNKAIDSVIISMNDGYGDIVVLGNQEQLFDSSLASEEFDENETVTQPGSIQSILNDIGDNVDVDDLETAGGASAAPESTEGGEANFAAANNASTDINADLRERKFDDTTEDNRGETNTIVDTVDLAADAGTVGIDTVSGDDVINASEDDAPTIEVTGT